eukprot:scaffold11161_cov36-Phaeocystis_antarctica.AAC.1
MMCTWCVLVCLWGVLLEPPLQCNCMPPGCNPCPHHTTHTPGAGPPCTRAALRHRPEAGAAARGGAPAGGIARRARRRCAAAGGGGSGQDDAARGRGGRAQAPAA